MTEAAAAAVKHDHNLVGNGDAEGLGGCLVVDVFGSGHLNFAVMITPTQGADQIKTPLDGFVAAGRSIGALEAASFFGHFKIFRQGEPVSQAPARALFRN